MVLVDDNFHYKDVEERYCLGAFPTYAEAVVACRQIVDEFLLADHKPGMLAAELCRRYKTFGEDPWIANVDGHPRFSAWDYAESRAKEICEA